MKKVVLLIAISLVMVGCKESLPQDLQQQRDWINRDMDEFIRKEENSEKYRNSTMLLVELKQLKKNTLYYKKALEAKGFGDRYNPEAVVFIDEKLAQYAGNNNSKETESNKHVCNICGRSFISRGYEERSTGHWVLMQAPYQSFICSSECGAVHTERQVKTYGF